MFPCKTCKGTGKFSAFVDGFKDGEPFGEYREGLTCTTCKGQGKITQAYFDRIEAGKELRRKRIEAGYSLAEWAKILGKSASEISRIERGEQP